MNTVKNYFEKTSQHLFKGFGKLQKIEINENGFTIYRFSDNDLSLLSKRDYTYDQVTSTGGSGKKYVSNYFKSMLFPQLPDNHYKSIPHFKLFKEKWEEIHSVLVSE